MEIPTYPDERAPVPTVPCDVATRARQALALTLPQLERLGDLDGNGPVSPEAPLGARCHATLAVKDAIDAIDAATAEGPVTIALTGLLDVFASTIAWIEQADHHDDCDTRYRSRGAPVPACDCGRATVLEALKALGFGDSNLSASDQADAALKRAGIEVDS